MTSCDTRKMRRTVYRRLAQKLRPKDVVIRLDVLRIEYREAMQRAFR